MNNSSPSIPWPGSPVRGSKTGKPIMALFDLLGRTWAMGVVWNLSKGPCSFRELQARCEQLSPTVLNRRLAELRATSLVEQGQVGYQLTAVGASLFQLLTPFEPFSKQWAESIAQNHGPSGSGEPT